MESINILKLFFIGTGVLWLFLLIVTVLMSSPDKVKVPPAPTQVVSDSTLWDDGDCQMDTTQADKENEQDDDENDADGQSGHKCRDGNLLRAIQNCGHKGLLHPQIAVDILNRNGGVIHQDAHCQRKPPQRHYIDRLPQEIEKDE